MSKEKGMSLRRWMILLAVVLVIISSISFFITRNIYDSQRFADKVSESLTTQPASGAIANELSTAILENEEPVAQIVLQKPVNALIVGLIESDLFTAVINKTSYALNSFITSHDFDEVSIDTSSIAQNIDSFADAIYPENDLDLSSQANQDIVLYEGADVPSFKSIGTFLLILGPLTLLGALGILVASWINREDKWQCIYDANLVVIISSIILLVITYTSGALLTVNIIDPDKSVIMEQIYKTFVSDFRIILVIALGLGAILFVLLRKYRSQISKKLNSLSSA